MFGGSYALKSSDTLLQLSAESWKIKRKKAPKITSSQLYSYTVVSCNYLESSVLSTEKDIDTLLAKA